MSSRAVSIGSRVSLALFSLVSSAAMADSVSSKRENSQEHGVEYRSTKSSDVPRAYARHWDLDDTEWERYRTLLQGIRGSVSPANLSPIEVLGIHARTDAERNRYARQWAKMMREDAERILAFQLAYDAAQRELYPGTTLIDNAKVSQLKQAAENQQQGILKAEDRLLFFTETTCAICNVLLKRLFNRLASVQGIDVYFLDVVEGEESLIRSWAIEQHLEPTWVRDRRVTLNVDGGLLSKLTTSLALEGPDRPLVLRRRDEQLSVVPAYRF